MISVRGREKVLKVHQYGYDLSQRKGASSRFISMDMILNKNGEVNCSIMVAHDMTDAEVEKMTPSPHLWYDFVHVTKYKHLVKREYISHYITTHVSWYRPHWVA